MDYTIVYENTDILAVNKPAGVLVHSVASHSPVSEEGSLLDKIQLKYPNAELAHRLDKDTSGLLLIAKNYEAWEYLKSLFQKREITKKYITLVAGKVAKDEGIIALPVGRSKKDFRKRIASPRGGEDFRAAETHWKVLKRFHDYTLLEVYPKTGRTHQIRSHLSSVGHPVACDKLYGGKRYICPAGLSRQFLHAAGLEFTAKNGEHIRLESDLPDDLKSALESL